jgi:Nuclease subunit of the excinuclease complex
VFKNGNPSKSDYRRFNIRSLEGKIDDFESMREAVTRRYTRLLNEKLPLPNLIMVDGGKGQVSAAREMLDVLGLEKIPVVGLAEKHEEIVFSDSRDSLLLDRSNPALRILIAVRDECHRFATSANQRMRSREASFALLESIEGVGKERSQRVMKKYESVENILKRDAATIAKETGIPEKVAERILYRLEL